jgi:hypothetical protein
MALLDEKQKKAIETWYARDEIIAEVRRLRDAGLWEEVEEYVHMGALLPLGKRESLPDYMFDEKKKPLFPDNLSPVGNEEGWQDAIDIGWTVIEKTLGLSHDEVHVRIRDIQDADWDKFLRRDKKK